MGLAAGGGDAPPTIGRPCSPLLAAGGTSMPRPGRPAGWRGGPWPSSAGRLGSQPSEWARPDRPDARGAGRRRGPTASRGVHHTPRSDRRAAGGIGHVAGSDPTGRWPATVPGFSRLRSGGRRGRLPAGGRPSPGHGTRTPRRWPTSWASCSGSTSIPLAVEVAAGLCGIRWWARDHRGRRRRDGTALVASRIIEWATAWPSTPAKLVGQTCTDRRIRSGDRQPAVPQPAVGDHRHRPLRSRPASAGQRAVRRSGGRATSMPPGCSCWPRPRPGRAAAAW